MEKRLFLENKLAKYIYLYPEHIEIGLISACERLFRRKPCLDMLLKIKALKMENREINSADILLQLVDTEIFSEVLIWTNDALDEPMPSDFWPFVCELREEVKRNIVRDLSQDQDLTKDPQGFADKVAERFLELEENTTSVNVRDYTVKVIDYIEKLFEDDGKLMGLKTGFVNLDKILGGLRSGTLTVIAGRSSMGKSTMSLNIILNAAKNGARIYLQALEETKVSVIMRMIANIANVDLEKMQRGELSATDFERIGRANNIMSKLDIIVDDQSGLRSSKILSNVLSHYLAKPLDLVVIDHIQEIREDRMLSRREQIDYSLENFRKLSKKLKIPVIIVSQLSRVAESSSDKRPMLSHLKESGGIEEKADAVILLYRESYYTKENINPDNLEVIVAKNRNGRVGVTYLDYFKNTMRISQREQNNYKQAVNFN